MAPGTFGSVFGVFLFWLLVWLGVGLAAYAFVVVVVSAVGIWASGRCEELFAKKDDGRIVIDEVAGQLITLLPVFWLGSGILWVVTGFVAFRVLDIWKPGPVRWAERRFHGGFGVMADDLLAGMIGALILAAGMSLL